jgi:hypothetical protein
MNYSTITRVFLLVITLQLLQLTTVTCSHVTEISDHGVTFVDDDNIHKSIPWDVDTSRLSSTDRVVLSLSRRYRDDGIEIINEMLAFRSGGSPGSAYSDAGLIGKGSTQIARKGLGFYAKRTNTRIIPGSVKIPTCTRVVSRNPKSKNSKHCSIGVKNGEAVAYLTSKTYTGNDDDIRGKGDHSELIAMDAGSTTIFNDNIPCANCMIHLLKHFHGTLHVAFPGSVSKTYRSVCDFQGSSMTPVLSLDFSDKHSCIKSWIEFMNLSELIPKVAKLTTKFHPNSVAYGNAFNDLVSYTVKNIGLPRDMAIRSISIIEYLVTGQDSWLRGY